MPTLPSSKTASKKPVPTPRPAGPTKRERVAQMIADAEPEGGISFNRIANALGGNRTQVHDMIKLMIADGKVKRVGEGSAARLVPVK